ncbi:MAG TPA: Uma2 family endonuclease [Chloroflexota bacterium]|jgi:Uma2 family endonuclease
MAVIDSRITYELLQQMPEDGKRYELIDGDIFVSPSPIPRHQRTVSNFDIMLRAVEQRGYGQAFIAPLDVVFDEYNVAEPDALFIVTERLHIITYTNIQGAPDLLVEVLSDGTAHRDVGVKLHMYARFKVPHYWVADAAEQSLQRYELRGERYSELPKLYLDDAFTCPLFPEIDVRVAELFG